MNFEQWCDLTERDPSDRDLCAAWEDSRTATLEEAVGNIHALRASHIADAPTCDYVSCDFVSAWDDAVAAIRAIAKGDGE